MRQYIVNLTDTLIGKHRFVAVQALFFKANQSTAFFREYVQGNLFAADVKDMSPETLGKIMCSFEVGDVKSGDLVKDINLWGYDCGDLLRGLVALALAYVIVDRLNHAQLNNVPPYTMEVPAPTSNS